MTPARPSTLRRLEIVLHALLGRPYRVKWGSQLAGDADTVWLPPQPLPFRVQLVQALQACMAAQSPIVQREAEAGGWKEVLANLYAEERLRDRFPGLRSTYEFLHTTTPTEPASTSLGDQFLELMLGSSIAPRRPPRVVEAYESWRREWEAWIRRPKRHLPLPSVPPPTRRLPYQAARRSLREEADPPAVPGAAGFPPPSPNQMVIGVTPQGHRLVIQFPTQESSQPVSLDRGVPFEAVATALAEPSRSQQALPTDWYDEWDSLHGRYLPNWCAVFETPVTMAGVGSEAGDMVGSAAVRRVRRAFEHYRSAKQWSRRETEGDELDVEAVVEALTESRGVVNTERIFMSKRLRQPEAAVAVLIDLSDSVSGMTLEIERQALVLLGTALDGVGDAFAFYGFRGRSRLRCEIHRIKAFGDEYGPDVARRIAAVRPAGYTRIAPALRHVAAQLSRTEDRHKILLLVTDGMPFDVGGYGGDYAVEDTRRAWLEARARGIRPYCLNVDFTTSKHLPRMCGPASWTVVGEPHRLPDALVALYERVRT